MRTGRSLTVCWCLLPGGGGLCSGGVSAPGGVWSGGGVSSPGGGVSAPRGSALWGGIWSRGWPLLWGGVVSQHALRQTPPLWTESQTPVKTLPWPNFVAAGNKSPQWPYYSGCLIELSDLDGAICHCHFARRWMLKIKSGSSKLVSLCMDLIINGVRIMVVFNLHDTSIFRLVGKEVVHKWLSTTIHIDLCDRIMQR